MPDPAAQDAADTSQSASEASTASPPDVAVSGADSAAPAEPRKPTASDYARLRQQQKALRKEREAMQGQRAQWEQQSQGFQSQLQQLQAQVREATENLALAKSDPLAWAEKNGVDPNKAVRGYLANGTPEKAIEQTRAELAEARKELEAYKREQHEKEQARVQQAIQATDEQAVGSFLNVIQTNAKDWPYTNAVFTRDEIAGKLWELQRIGQQKNERYSLQQVREAFERFAKTRYEKIQEATKALLQPEETPAPVTAPAKKSQASRQPSPAKQSSSTTVPGKKKTARQLEAEARAAALAEIRAGIAKDAANRAKESGTKASTHGVKH